MELNISVALLIAAFVVFFIAWAMSGFRAFTPLGLALYVLSQLVG